MDDAVQIKLSIQSFTYKGAEDPALEQIELELRAGQVLAVCGATGAGKSTLVQTLNAIVPRFHSGELSGEILVAGLKPSDKGVAVMARKVGMVFQDFESQLFGTTCRAEVAFAMENLAVPRDQMKRKVPELLALVGLAGFEDRSPSSLSGGQKQRLALASILAMDPDVLVLDEPTTDLDPKGKEEVWRLIHELRGQGKTMVVIEHGTHAMNVADLALVLDCGRVAYLGPPADLLKDPKLLLDRGVKPPEGAELLYRLDLPVTGWEPGQVIAELKRAGMGVGPAEQPERKSERGPALFSIRDLSFGYPDGPEVLHDVNLEIGRGEIVALLGPNGSGKTTLVKLMTGLIPAPKGSGEVLYADEPITGKGQGALGRRIGFVFQNPDAQIFSSTVLDEVAFGLRNFGVDSKQIPGRVTKALETVGLAGREREDPFVMTKGDRQKLAVASVLACEPETIVLDEPSTGLDERELAGMADLLRTLHQRGHTVVMVTHSLSLAADLAERCIVLKDGRIAADADPRNLFSDDKTCSEAHLVPPDSAIIAQQMGARCATVDALVEALTAREPG